MATSGNPQPEECTACRVARDLATGKCLPNCEEPNFLSSQKLCISEQGNCYLTQLLFLRGNKRQVFFVFGPR